LTVTELASALGVGRTVVYRLVVTLEAHSLVRRSADGRARLGLGVLALAQQAQPLLRDAALPIVRALADEAGATAYLGVVDGPDLLSLVGAEPTTAEVHVAFRVGTRTPLERGAAGRAILAMRTTGGRPLDPPWVISTGDAANGGYGVAACVTGIPGVECVVGVVTLAEPDEARIGPIIARAAGEITRTLG
jgi:DNA-binding IclR family transcriptional regulator